MAEDQRPGTVYWIDHFAVPTNDLSKWLTFTMDVLGGKLARINGANTEARKRGQSMIGFCHMPYSMIDGFLQDEMLPAAAEPGAMLPRFGYFIRAEDIDEHLRRLDEYHVPHTDPIRTSAEGQDGTAIRFTDPDGNQLEFWAPARMPTGAMEGAGPLKVGRISHGVYESRDLERTADFYDRFAALDPIRSVDVPKDTLAMPLAGGGRIVYHQVDELGSWTTARARGQGPHTALTVRDDDYFENYRRMWATLPDTGDSERGDTQIDQTTLPARTVMHGSGGGRKWFQLFGRGDDFYDWDANAFHFIGSEGLERSPGMTYKAHSMEYHVERVPKDASGRPVV
ncbi:MAG: Glyoxalase/Bleomycin resistance protein/Dioxygenase superfamily [Chloroflexota bacterium]|jgi:extradiol dioxygenase family protein|nr:Glyoxalase/Bleomycin resistance protein/Dioxygenase superfamily [Chloroflexota bacterium]